MGFRTGVRLPSAPLLRNLRNAVISRVSGNLENVKKVILERKISYWNNKNVVKIVVRKISNVKLFVGLKKQEKACQALYRRHSKSGALQACYLFKMHPAHLFLRNRLGQPLLKIPIPEALNIFNLSIFLKYSQIR